MVNCRVFKSISSPSAPTLSSEMCFPGCFQFSRSNSLSNNVPLCASRAVDADSGHLLSQNRGVTSSTSALSKCNAHPPQKKKKSQHFFLNALDLNRSIFAWMVLPRQNGSIMKVKALSTSADKLQSQILLENVGCSTDLDLEDRTACVNRVLSKSRNVLACKSHVWVLQWFYLSQFFHILASQTTTAFVIYLVLEQSHVSTLTVCIRNLISVWAKIMRMQLFHWLSLQEDLLVNLSFDCFEILDPICWVPLLTSQHVHFWGKSRTQTLGPEFAMPKRTTN